MNNTKNGRILNRKAKGKEEEVQNKNINKQSIANRQLIKLVIYISIHTDIYHANICDIKAIFEKVEQNWLVL